MSHHMKHEETCAPDMGIFGVILATGLALLISICVLSPYFFKRENKLHLIRAKPEWKYIRRGLTSGFPSFLTEASSGIVMSIYFISSEKAYFWHIVSLSIGPIVLIPTAFLSSSPFDMIGVWCAYPTSESIVFLIGVSLYFVSIKKAKPQSSKTISKSMTKTESIRARDVFYPRMILPVISNDIRKTKRFLR